VFHSFKQGLKPSGYSLLFFADLKVGAIHYLIFVQKLFKRRKVTEASTHTFFTSATERATAKQSNICKKKMSGNHQYDTEGIEY